MVTFKVYGRSSATASRAVFADNIFVTPGVNLNFPSVWSLPSNPNPANKATNVNPAATTQVSWTKSADPNLIDMYTSAIDNLQIYNYQVSQDAILAEAHPIIGKLPRSNPTLTGSQFNSDNTASSYCNVDRTTC